MNWLITSNQKLIRLLVRFLCKIQKPILATLEALRSLEFLAALGFALALLADVLGAAALGTALAFGLVALALLTTTLAGLLAFALATTLAALGTVLASALERNESELILPPGAGLRDLLHFIYPPKTAERVFDQIIADMQLEWQAAMVKDQPWLARWVRVRGVLTVFLTAAVHVVATLGSILKPVR